MENEIPDKRYFRIGEVSRLTELEPHVIRYWEKEFPRLKPLRADSRQRLYSRADVRLIMDIRRLLHEERYTIAGAKRKLRGRVVEPPPKAASEPAPVSRNTAQPDLPLFSGGEGSETPPDREPDRRFLTEIKEELRRIRRVLS